MKNFKDKVVIVTGASSGIGEAMARELPRKGARVCWVRAACETAAHRGRNPLTGRAGRLLRRRCDERRRGPPVDRDRRERVRRNRRAGLQCRAFDACDLRRCGDLGVLHRLMDVNFWGTVNCCKFALPYLQQSHGSIVGISSVAGLHGLRGGRAIRREIRHDGFSRNPEHRESQKGLHVAIACPGFTASNVRFSASRPTGRRSETPRNEAKMITSAEVASISSPRRPEAQASLPDGERGARHPFRSNSRRVSSTGCSIW